MDALAPSLPLSPIEPSLPLIETPSLPFSPLTVIVPGFVLSPIVISFAKPTCSVGLPLSVTTLVTTLPSPLTFTVSPKFALAVVPLSSDRPKPPLLVASVILLIDSFKSPTFTAFFKISPEASFKATAEPSACFKPLSILTI